MKLIETITVGAGTTSTISFTNIPQTYTDLLLVGSVRMSNNNALGYNTVRFNSDSGANYTYLFLNGNGSSLFQTITTTATFTFATTCGNANTSNTFGNFQFYIANYAGSTHKSISSIPVTENNATEAFMDITSSVWRSSSAITSITINDAIYSANFQQYSSISLYGILKGSGGADAA